MRTNQNGSILVMVTIISAVLITLSMLFLDEMKERFKVVWMLEDYSQARYGAEAGLEEIKYRANSSSYTGTRNVWLMSNATVGGNLVVNDMLINGMAVDVTLYDLGGGSYRAVASAINNQIPYRIATEIKESRVETMAKYAYASTSGVNGGDLALRLNGFADFIRGDVHTNGRMVFGEKYSWPAPGGISKYGIPVDGNVTAVNGVGTWVQGREDASWAEGDLVGESVSGTIDGHVSALTFPNYAVAGNIQSQADDYPNYFIHWSNPKYAPYGDDTGGDGMPFNLNIILLGDQIQIDFLSNATGAIIHTELLPLPSHKLLWIDGGTTVKGDINGRLSIATTTGTAIDGNIRYVDNEGDRAYVLKKNGVVVDPDSTGTESWTAANGYSYEPNPDYNPVVPANLTLFGGVGMGLGLSASSPYNMEVHAATLAAYWQCGYGPNWNKGNFRMVGSVVPIFGRNDADADHHFRLSNEMIHDPNLISNPPEWYPSSTINTPVFTAWRRY